MCLTESKHIFIGTKTWKQPISSKKTAKFSRFGFKPQLRKELFSYLPFSILITAIPLSMPEFTCGNCEGGVAHVSATEVYGEVRVESV